MKPLLVWLSLALGLLSGTSVRAQDFAYTVKNSTVTITDYLKGNTFPGGSSANPVLIATVPSSIDGLPVTALGPKAFANKTFLTGVVVAPTVQEIGDDCFSGSLALTAVTFAPGSGIRRIGARAFKGDFGLTACNLPEGLTFLGEECFSSCSHLLRCQLPASLGTVLPRAFYSCSRMTFLDLGGVVTFGDNAAEGCSSLETLNLGKVEVLGKESFKGCSKLPALELPDSVRVVGDNLASNCKALVTAGTGNTLDRTSTGMFRGCSQLTTFTMGTSVKQVGPSTFQGCSKLESLHLFDVVDIGDSACEGCSGLDLIELGPDLKSVGMAAFTGTISLKTIKFPDSVESIGGACLQGSGVESVLLGTGLKTVGEQMCDSCPNLKSLRVPDGVTELPSGFVHNCPKLESLVLGSGLLQIHAEAINSCASLATLVVPDSVVGIDARGITDNINLTTISFGTGLANLGGGALAGNTKLTAAYFAGHAPTINGKFGGRDITLFAGANGTAYYNPAATDWITIPITRFGGWPTAPGRLTHGPPEIVTQPKDAKWGSPGVTLSVVAKTSNPPLSYQWFYRSLTGSSAKVDGATSPELLISGVKGPRGLGTYFVRVSDAGGESVDSVDATVSYKFLEIVKQPQSVKLPVSADSATLTVEVEGEGPFTYEWFHYSDRPPNFRYRVGDQQKLRVPNATTPTFESRPDSFEPNAVGWGAYYVIILDANGFEVLSSIVRVAPEPPTFRQQPLLSTSELGVTFTAELDGNGIQGTEWITTPGDETLASNATAQVDSKAFVSEASKVREVRAVVHSLGGVTTSDPIWIGSSNVCHAWAYPRMRVCRDDPFDLKIIRTAAFKGEAILGLETLVVSVTFLEQGHVARTKRHPKFQFYNVVFLPGVTEAVIQVKVPEELQNVPLVAVDCLIHNLLDYCDGRRAMDVTFIDCRPRIRMAESTLNVVADDPNRAARVVVMCEGERSKPATIRYRTEAGSGQGVEAASPGFDYEPRQGMVEFAVGQASAEILIPIKPGGLGSLLREFKVVLSEAAGAALDSPAVTSVLISDASTPPSLLPPSLVPGGAVNSVQLLGPQAVFDDTFLVPIPIRRTDSTGTSGSASLTLRTVDLSPEDLKEGGLAARPGLDFLPMDVKVHFPANGPMDSVQTVNLLLPLPDSRPTPVDSRSAARRIKLQAFDVTGATLDGGAATFVDVLPAKAAAAGIRITRLTESKGAFTLDWPDESVLMRLQTIDGPAVPVVDARKPVMISPETLKTWGGNQGFFALGLPPVTALPTDWARPGSVFNVASNQNVDYGDLPASYEEVPAYNTELSILKSVRNPAGHVINPSFTLGKLIDAELSNQPGGIASLDDVNGLPDEDGVKFPTPLKPGEFAEVVVTTSQAGFLDAWIDFERDGTFLPKVPITDGSSDNFLSVWVVDTARKPNDQPTSLPLTPGPNTIRFRVPKNAVPGPTFARFRLSKKGFLTPHGIAPDGEVEDYAVTIQAP